MYVLPHLHALFLCGVWWLIRNYKFHKCPKFFSPKFQNGWPKKQAGSSKTKGMPFWTISGLSHFFPILKKRIHKFLKDLGQNPGVLPPAIMKPWTPWKDPRLLDFNPFGSSENNPRVSQWYSFVNLCFKTGGLSLSTIQNGPLWVGYTLYFRIMNKVRIILKLRFKKINLCVDSWNLKMILKSEKWFWNLNHCCVP